MSAPVVEYLVSMNNTKGMDWTDGFILVALQNGYAEMSHYLSDALHMTSYR